MARTKRKNQTRLFEDDNQAEVINLAEAKEAKRAGRYKNTRETKPTVTPSAFRIAGGHWLITAFCEDEDEQYHYLGIENEGAPPSERYSVFEVFPSEEHTEVGDFPSLDQAMDEIQEALEEPIAEPDDEQDGR